MALLFEQFGVRRVELDVLMWPGFDHGFKQGELSALWGALNGDDLFEACDLRANVGATFDSEHWSYDISTTRIRISSEAFRTFEDLDRRIMNLLEVTQQFFTPRRVPFLTADRAFVMGVVPQDADKDVPGILRSKLLARRLTQSQGGTRLLDSLPGDVGGVGLELVGDTEECHWHARIGPAHAGARALRLSADLYWSPPFEAPEHSMISERLESAYKFVAESVLEFAQTSLG